IEKSGVDIVPKFVITGGNGDGNGNSSSHSAFETLIAMLLSEKILPVPTVPANGDGLRDNGQIKRIRDSILAQLSDRQETPPANGGTPTAATSDGGAKA